MYKEALAEIVEKIPDLMDNGQPVTVTEEMTEEHCKGLVSKVIPVLNANDYFTNETKAVLKEFGWTREGGYVKPGEAEKELTLLEVIESSENFKELKTMALSEPEFKPIRGRMASYKTIDLLREAMINVLTAVDTPELLHQKLEAEPIRTFVEEVKTVEEVKEEIVEEIVEEIKEEPQLAMAVDTKELMPALNMRNVSSLKIRPPFSTLFTINPLTLEGIVYSMKHYGYDMAYPIVIWNDIIVDGHTRLQAAIITGIDVVPVEVKEFKEQWSALNYAVHNQKDRRNLSDIELLRAIALVDKPISRTTAGRKGGEKAAGQDVSEKEQPTHKITAKLLGVGESVVTDARTVLKNKSVKRKVLRGELSLREGAEKVRKKGRRLRKPLPVQDLGVSREVKAVMTVMKKGAGKEMTLPEICQKSDALMGKWEDKPTPIELEELVGIIFEVLLMTRMITATSGDSVLIKKMIVQ